MNEGLQTVSLRENPELLERFCGYFSLRWGKEELYRDCMQSALQTSSPLPQWFLLLKGDEIAGGCGLITNDFISRMDLYPWLCAVYVEEKFRGQGGGGILIDRAVQAAFAMGFDNVYCCTDHTGYYEKYDFKYIGIGYHPWNETSRIYCRSKKPVVDVAG
ncbi:MAG: GNAT family N-acetyltransferase [Lentisphaeria bacterium]|nr:GNAT family N-acetyltransferase [Lentisphaerota bacterium]MBR7145453.1 GNAT family N-acetyltransferase [Lentisphaeria bacterium]